MNRYLGDRLRFHHAGGQIQAISTRKVRNEFRRDLGNTTLFRPCELLFGHANLSDGYQEREKESYAKMEANDCAVWPCNFSSGQSTAISRCDCAS